MHAPITSSDDLHINDAIKAPRYMQIFSTLRQWIAQGHYAPGTRMEPEKQLCEMFGVSRITIRKAIEMLAAEDLVESKQGKGTFVRADQPRTPIHANMSQRIERARELARNSDVSELQIVALECPAETCADLNVSAGTELLRVSYVRKLRGIRIGYVESYCRSDLNISIDERDFRNNTLLTLLEDKGVSLSGIDHLVGATLADTRLAGLLDLNVGAPLVRVKMVMLDTRHRPVQKVIGYFRADEYEHHMFLARPGQEKQL